MIIRQVTLHNLFTYHGPQTLELPAEQGSTLTVVVAPNNSGKTSIIRALKFCFYGEKGMPPGSKLANLINNRHKVRVDQMDKLETL
jgi:DNA repair exonuclease SbcCD ATPase subunit